MKELGKPTPYQISLLKEQRIWDYRFTLLGFSLFSLFRSQLKKEKPKYVYVLLLLPWLLDWEYNDNGKCQKDSGGNQHAFPWLLLKALCSLKCFGSRLYMVHCISHLKACLQYDENMWKCTQKNKFASYLSR